LAYLLNLLYLVALVVVSPWLVHAAIVKGKYREGWREKLFGSISFDGVPSCEQSERPSPMGDVVPIAGPRVWFHAVSVGEVNLLVGIVAQIRREHPDWQCVISTTTTTGMKLARQRFADLPLFYCPLDFSWAVRRAMARVKPDLLVLAELELWPNLISAARRSDAKVAVINGRLGEASFRGYRRIRPIVARMLRSLDLVAAQNSEYADRFRALGTAENVLHVTGSLKFDGARTDRRNRATEELRRLAGIKDDDVVLLAGSTQDPEERLALETYRHLSAEFPQLRLILVPRHAERFEEIAQMLEREGVDFVRRSNINDALVATSPRVLFVDTIGELGAWWGTARIAYVGGSMGSRGGQNMIEPAAYGAAVSFGPKTRNFRDIVNMLLYDEAAVVIPDGDALTCFTRRCLEDPQYMQTLGVRAQALVVSQRGATSETIERLAALLKPADQMERSRAG